MHNIKAAFLAAFTHINKQDAALPHLKDRKEHGTGASVQPTQFFSAKNLHVAKNLFLCTIPVMAGYIVLGAAYGILMDSKGFSILWSLLASVFIYAGSMQFVTIALLSASFDPLSAFLMTLAVNARHIFYGISMLHKYRGTGNLKPYLVFSLTDESFSILCSTNPPQDTEPKWFYFFISFLNQMYWITGTILGGILGSLMTFNTKGLDFVLTALFVVILIDQWKSTANHYPAIIGIASAIFCRLIFGAGNFIIPSMILILLLVTVFRTRMEKPSTEIHTEEELLSRNHPTAGGKNA
ncbi:MAG: AzlC family ABC transporter permease [Mobilitalea sp.]